MKKKIYRFFALMLVCTGLLSGCGAEMYELTEKEEDVIVQYAAYVLSKHNIYQKDGMVKLEPEEYRESTEVQETQTEEPGTESEVQNISITAAIGREDGIAFQYLGQEVKSVYQEGEHYYLEASSGKTFLVMHFMMKNTTEQDIDLNVMKSNPDFYCRINGGEAYVAESALANTVLSTYMGKIKALEEQEVVLLFEIPQATSENIEDLQLLLEQDGTKLPVIL